jgi:hypothetical protein
MKFSLWTQHGARNSVPVFNAFRDSILSAGHHVVENSHDADVDVIWSVLWSGRMSANRSIFNNKKPTVVLEVGAIQRGTTWKVGLNGIDNRSIICTKNNNSKRAEHFGLHLKPWKNQGSHILVCCQNPNSEMWKGMPAIAEWTDTVIRALRAQSAMPIIVRTHPRASFRTIRSYTDVNVVHPRKLTGTYDDYDLNFEGAYAVVNWSSNPGALAVIAGVPVFTGPTSLAAAVANKNLSDITDPSRPDRQQWLNDYAHTEYTLDEISQGIPLNDLLKLLDK